MQFPPCADQSPASNFAKQTQTTEQDSIKPNGFLGLSGVVTQERLVLPLLLQPLLHRAFLNCKAC